MARVSSSTHLEDCRQLRVSILGLAIDGVDVLDCNTFTRHCVALGDTPVVGCEDGHGDGGQTTKLHQRGHKEKTTLMMHALATAAGGME